MLNDWPREDLAAVVADLCDEFPSSSPEVIEALVSAAQIAVPVAAGRIALTAKAREFVRGLRQVSRVTDSWRVSICR